MRAPELSPAREPTRPHPRMCTRAPHPLFNYEFTLELQIFSNLLNPLSTCENFTIPFHRVTSENFIKKLH